VKMRIGTVSRAKVGVSDECVEKVGILSVANIIPLCKTHAADVAKSG
jgi:hypothetical protein